MQREIYKFMFRIHENPLFNKEVFSKIKKFAHRLLVCFEKLDKQGNETRPHYHGYVELDATKTTQQNYDKIRNVLKHYVDKKSNYGITKLGFQKDDEKGAMSYTAKQGDIVEEYNTSFDIDELASWWKQVKKEQKVAEEKAKKIFQEKLVLAYITESVNGHKSFAELKIWIAHKICDEGKLPVMSKVRACTMYVISKCKLTHFLECEIEKLL